MCWQSFQGKGILYDKNKITIMNREIKKKLDI